MPKTPEHCVGWCWGRGRAAEDTLGWRPVPFLSARLRSEGAAGVPGHSEAFSLSQPWCLPLHAAAEGWGDIRNTEEGRLWALSGCKPECSREQSREKGKLAKEPKSQASLLFQNGAGAGGRRGWIHPTPTPAPAQGNSEPESQQGVSPVLLGLTRMRRKGSTGWMTNVPSWMRSGTVRSGWRRGTWCQDTGATSHFSSNTPR